MKWRFVWIYQDNTLDGPCPMLEICEVQVFGMSSWINLIQEFIDEKQLSRSLIEDEKVHFVRTFYSLGCKTGHYGIDCGKTCNHCKNNETCNIDTGQCDISGCAINFSPPLFNGKIFIKC